MEETVKQWIYPMLSEAGYLYWKLDDGGCTFFAGTVSHLYCVYLYDSGHEVHR